MNGDLTNFGGPEDLQAILDELKANTSATIMAVPGNCDTQEVFLELEREGMNLHRSGNVIAGGLAIMAVGGSNITPFGTPIEFEEHDIAQFLEDGFEAVRETGSIILFSHFPPKDTVADKIKSGAHVGSDVLREFIEGHPDVRLVVCGHIHEGIGEDKIKDIPVVNPGMASDGHFVAIDVAEDAGKGHKITYVMY